MHGLALCVKTKVPSSSSRECRGRLSSSWVVDCVESSGGWLLGPEADISSAMVEKKDGQKVRVDLTTKKEEKT